MLLTENQNLEESIICLLTKGSLTGPEIIDAIQGKYKTTEQATYRALKRLLHMECVVKLQKKYTIGHLWANSVIAALDNHQNSQQFAIDELQEKEYLQFEFPSLIAADYVWAHMLSYLLLNQEISSPFFIYNTHQIFALARNENELKLLSSERPVYVALGGNTQHDKYFRKEWNSKLSGVTLGNSFGYDNTFYLNCIGDYCIEVKIKQSLAQEISQLYEKITDAQELSTRIGSLFKKPSRTKLVIYHDSDRTKKHVRKLMKDFAIKKNSI